MATPTKYKTAQARLDRVIEVMNNLADGYEVMGRPALVVQFRHYARWLSEMPLEGRPVTVPTGLPLREVVVMFRNKGYPIMSFAHMLNTMPCRIKAYWKDGITRTFVAKRAHLVTPRMTEEEVEDITDQLCTYYEGIHPEIAARHGRKLLED